METTEKHEEKVSEILARAAKLLNDAPKVYETNFELMKEQDALQQDLLHKLEIENLTRDERAKLATELRDCRRLRRKYKDVVEELEPIAGYCGTAAGMQAVKQLSRFVGELRKVENYHQNRHYVPRSGRVKGESQDCALPGFVDSKNEEKTERNAGYLVVSHSGGGMLRQGTRKGIRRTPANRGMRAHRIVKSLDISEDVCHGLCP